MDECDEDEEIDVDVDISYLPRDDDDGMDGDDDNDDDDDDDDGIRAGDDDDDDGGGHDDDGGDDDDEHVQADDQEDQPAPRGDGPYLKRKDHEHNESNDVSNEQAVKHKQFADKAFGGHHRPIPPGKLVCFVDKIIQILKKDDAETKKAEENYRRSILKRRNQQSASDGHSSASRYEEVIEDILAKSKGTENHNGGADHLESFGIYGSNIVYDSVAGLEKNNGRFAVVVMKYVSESNPDEKGTVLVKGNFIEECSSYYAYTGSLRVDDLESKKQFDRYNITNQDGKVYTFSGTPEVQYRDFNSSLIHEMFARAGIQLSVEDVEREWAVLRDHKRRHRRGPCSPKPESEGDRALCDLVVEISQNPVFSFLKTVEYFMHRLIPDGVITKSNPDRPDTPAQSVKVDVVTLMEYAGAKGYLCYKMISYIIEFFPKKKKFLIELSYAEIAGLYDDLRNKPFLFCFNKTKPYSFLDELSYAQLESITKELEAKDGPCSPSTLGIVDKCAVYVYHDILLPNMHGEDKKDKARNTHKWNTLKNSENSYVSEESVVSIVRASFPGANDDTTALAITRDAISLLVKHGVATVDCVDKEGSSVRDAHGKTPAYPPDEKSMKAIAQRYGRRSSLHLPKFIVMTVPAHVYTGMIAGVIRGVAKNCAMQGPVQHKDFLRNDSSNKLDEHQSDVIEHALRAPVTVLTGPAGSGKTTVLSMLYSLVDRSKTRVATLMSKTGSMLTRLGLAADTMHHFISAFQAWVNGGMVGASPCEGIEMIILDEATLCGLPATAQFLYIHYMYGNVKHIVLAGHDWQLPAFEYGAVFKDIMAALPAYTFRLTKCYRTESLTIFNNGNAIFGFHKSDKAQKIKKADSTYESVLASAKSPNKRNWGNGQEQREKHQASLRVDDLVVLDDKDSASFGFVDPGLQWDKDECKKKIVLKTILNLVGNSFHTINQGKADSNAIGSQSSYDRAVHCLRTRLVEVISETHILVLRNAHADVINQGIHDELYASGFMCGLGTVPAELVEFMKNRCGISKPVAKNAWDLLKDQTEARRRVQSGEKALWVGEIFYHTKNNRERGTRNGEVLRVNGYLDVSVEQLEQYLSPIVNKGSAQADMDPDAIPDNGGPDSWTSGSKIPPLTEGETPQSRPCHTFDGIIRKSETINFKRKGDEKGMKVDVYEVAGPWTGGKPKKVVRLIETTYENDTVAWIQPINCVYMQYRDAGNDIFKQRFGEDESPGTRMGWATTIHRYQGAEQNVIIYAIGTKPDPYSNCQHAYVAVTRARKKVIILGDKSTLSRIASRPPVERNTTLADAIRRLKIQENFEEKRELMKAIMEDAKDVVAMIDDWVPPNCIPVPPERAITLSQPPATGDIVFPLARETSDGNSGMPQEREHRTSVVPAPRDCMMLNDSASDTCAETEEPPLIPECPLSDGNVSENVGVSCTGELDIPETNVNDTITREIRRHLIEESSNDARSQDDKPKEERKRKKRDDVASTSRSVRNDSLGACPPAAVKRKLNPKKRQPRPNYDGEEIAPKTTKQRSTDTQKGTPLKRFANIQDALAFLTEGI